MSGRALFASLAQEFRDELDVNGVINRAKFFEVQV